MKVEIENALRLMIMKNLLTLMMCLSFLGAFAENDEQKAATPAHSEDLIVSSADYETDLYVETTTESSTVELHAEEAESEVAPY